MKRFDDENFVKELNEKLKNGAVISFVTDTVWGVGCLPTSKEGADNIYELKGRDRSKPLILMSDSVEHLMPYVKNIPLYAKELMAQYFPGALTLIFEKSELTPDAITSNQNTVGIRVPNNPVFKRLCEVVDGHVLATTSANLSGQEAASSYDEAVKNVGENVAFVFEDDGFESKGLASTVALATGEEIVILRQGEVKI